MSELGQRAVASTVVFNFTTAVNGVPTTLSGSPVVSVYKNSTTESTSGITLTADYDGRTGLNHVVIDTSSDGTFYAASNDFSVVITTGTVGGVSVVGYEVGSFYLSSSASFPANFSSLLISASGHISNVDTLTTYTGDTPQTGDAYARIGAAGAGLTSLGDTRIAHLDADVSSRSTFAGGAVASVTGNVGGNVTGSVGSISGVTFPTRFSSLAIDISGDVTFNNTSIATVTNLTNAPTSGDFTAAMKTSLSAATPAVTVSDKTGFKLASDGVAAVTAWTVAITGNITGNLSGSVGSVTGLTASNLDATISSRLATSGYAAPDNADILLIKAKTDNLPVTPAAVGSAMTLTAAYDAAKTAATQTSADAIKTVTDNLSGMLEDSSGFRFTTHALEEAPTGGGGTAPTVVEIRQEMDSNSTRLAAIETVTDGLPAFVHTAGKLWVLDGNGNPLAPATQTQAIQDKTDNLPSDPADESLIIAATTSLASAIAALPTTSTVMPADIKKVNGVTVNGDGNATPWGP